MIWLDEVSGQMARVEGMSPTTSRSDFFSEKFTKAATSCRSGTNLRRSLASTFTEYDFDGRKFFSQVSVHQKTLASNYRRVGTPADAIPLVKAELEKLGTATVADKKSPRIN